MSGSLNIKNLYLETAQTQSRTNQSCVQCNSQRNIQDIHLHTSYNKQPEKILKSMVLTELNQLENLLIIKVSDTS